MIYKQAACMFFQLTGVRIQLSESGSTHMLLLSEKLFSTLQSLQGMLGLVQHDAGLEQLNTRQLTMPLCRDDPLS